MNVDWDGITLSKTLNGEAQLIRQQLADYARAYDWAQVLDILSENRECINSIRLDGSSFYAPLHQAAHGDAPLDVVQKLIEMGAWRTLRNAKEQRPVDIALAQNHERLVPLLSPQYQHQVPFDVLLKLQHNFHEVIRGRVRKLVEEHRLRLPQLEPLLESEEPNAWFMVPGMYGGFSYRLETPGNNPKLISESWCRVAGGSGQRHEITATGSELVDEGFV